jgi:hypothetical protein
MDDVHKSFIVLIHLMIKGNVFLCTVYRNVI